MHKKNPVQGFFFSSHMKRTPEQKNHLQLTLIALLAIMLAALTVNALDMQANTKKLNTKIQLLTNKINTVTTQAPVPAPTAVNTAPASNGIVLATSADNLFVLRGTATCTVPGKIYNITAPVDAMNPKNNHYTGKYYDLGYGDAQAPESQDLGTVVVQTTKQALESPVDATYTASAKTDDYVISSVLTNAVVQDAPDCKLWVADK